ncbi:MAG TPA: hypothetical protein VD963_00605 [Phycisphaerales bacterium]|nr:hypothetical protein [Phycisphaerales bacterium]
MHRGTVLLVGDSVRVAYQPRLSALLSEDGLRVVAPQASTGNCRTCRDQAQAWIEEHMPDIACFSCGQHAAEQTTTVLEREEVSLDEYEHDLLGLVETFRRFCGRQVVFVTMPPVHAERLAAGLAVPDAADLTRRLNRTIAQYNELALVLMGQMNVAVCDLHAELRRDLDAALGDDGVSLTPAGIEIAARAVAKEIYGVL